MDLSICILWGQLFAQGGMKKNVGKVINIYYSLKIYLEDAIFLSAWGRFNAVTRIQKEFSRVWD